MEDVLGDGADKNPATWEWPRVPTTSAVASFTHCDEPRSRATEDRLTLGHDGGLELFGSGRAM